MIKSYSNLMNTDLRVNSLRAIAVSGSIVIALALCIAPALAVNLYTPTSQPCNNQAPGTPSNGTANPSDPTSHSKAGTPPSEQVPEPSAEWGILALGTIGGGLALKRIVNIKFQKPGLKGIQPESNSIWNSLVLSAQSTPKVSQSKLTAPTTVMPATSVVDSAENAEIQWLEFFKV